MVEILDQGDNVKTKLTKLQQELCDMMIDWLRGRVNSKAYYTKTYQRIMPSSKELVDADVEEMLIEFVQAISARKEG